MTLRSASQAAAAKHKWQFTCFKDSDLVMLQEKKGEDFHKEKKRKLHLSTCGWLMLLRAKCFLARFFYDADVAGYGERKSSFSAEYL